MCDFCGQTPCDYRCPYATKIEVTTCEYCGCEIYEGDTYYELDGKDYCQDCAESEMTNAELLEALGIESDVAEVWG